MGETTKIEWADATWNPWYGCAKISPGCKFCYMYRDMPIYGRDPSLVTRSKTTFESPMKWQRGVGLKVDEITGQKTKPQFIFTCSWSDFFIEEADAWRADAWKIIRATPEFTYLILTKRPERILDHLPADWGAAGYPNVWLGVSAENQKYAELRIPYLLLVKAAKRFLSLEPLLGPIDLDATPSGNILNVCESCGETGKDDAGAECQECMGVGRIDWVIVGGESGNVARPMEKQWAVDLRDQCEASGVAFFFKQWGEWAPADAVSASAIAFAAYDRARNLYKVGTDKAGNLLDGVKHVERPEPFHHGVTDTTEANGQPVTPAFKVCAKCGGDPKPIEKFPIVKRSRKIGRWGKAREVVFNPDSWCMECRRKYDREYKSKRRNNKF